MKHRPIQLLLLSLVLLANLFAFKKQLVESYQSLKGKNLIEDISIGRNWSNFERFKNDSIEFTGWSEINRVDLALDPQSKGIVIYQFNRPQEAKVVSLHADLSRSNLINSQLSVSTDKENWQEFSLQSPPWNITEIIGDNRTFWIKIEGENNAQSGNPAVLLYQFSLMYYQKEIIFPPLTFMLATIFLPVLLIFCPKRKKVFGWLLFFIVFELGLNLGLEKLGENRYKILDNDVICLIHVTPQFLAADWKEGLLGNYCGNKESLNPLIIAAFWKLFGYGSEMAVRLSSFFFHLLTIIVVFFYGRKIKSDLVGIIASLFIATHPYLIELSTRGMRDTAFTFLVTVFAFLLWETNLYKLKSMAAIFITAAMSIYLRLHSLLQFIGLVGLWLIDTRKWRQAIIIIGSLLILTFPLVAHNLDKYGTWNYSEQMHLKWNANVEFAGQPGWPTKEEMARRPFDGPAISAFTYFFKLHTFSDLVKTTINGVISTFQYLYFRSFRLGILLFIWGVLLILRERRLRYIPVLVFLLEIPHFFLQGKGLVEYRSMTQSLPFIGLTLGYIIDRLWIKLKN